MSSTDPDDDRLVELQRQHEAELVALRRRHRLEMQAAEERHRAMVTHIRQSPSFELGNMLVSLRGKQGRRAFPGRLRKLWRRFRSRGPAPSRWVSVVAVPARPEIALSVLDEFTHACFAHEFELVPAKRDGGPNQLDGVDLVFTESAWRGNGSGWTGAFSRFGERSELPDLLAEARRRSIPTVFWNKEDPVNYDVFLEAARAFDHVFTTDADIVDRYRADLGHDRVAPMVFAAQPMLHNPIGRIQDSSREICFAGAWRGHKYPERVKSLTELLQAAATVGELVIYDRQPEVDDGKGFAVDFGKYVRGTLDYADMLDRYRQHAIFLNTNSVTTSSTMVARRVFEILACRTPVVSTPSKAIDELFGDLVPSPASRGESEEVLGQLLDIETRDRLGQRGYRYVHTNHTYAHRTADLMRAIGHEADMPKDPTVDVLLVSNRPEHLDAALDNYRRQDYGPKRLVFVTNSDAFDLELVRARLAEFPGALHLSMPESCTLGECLNAAIAQTNGDYFAKMDDDDWYGAAYLSDMLLTRHFADATVIGKRSTYAYVEGRDVTVVRRPGQEYKWTDLVVGATLVVKRENLGAIRFRALPRGTDSQFLKEIADAGLLIFSADRFNYCIERRAHAGDHTWQIADDEFMRGCRRVGTGHRIDIIGV